MQLFCCMAAMVPTVEIWLYRDVTVVVTGVRTAA